MLMGKRFYTLLTKMCVNQIIKQLGSNFWRPKVPFLSFRISQQIKVYLIFGITVKIL